ncbi:MAG: TonB-dependent receptor [Agarilytica sp.]
MRQDNHSKQGTLKFSSALSAFMCICALHAFQAHSSTQHSDLDPEFFSTNSKEERIDALIRIAKQTNMELLISAQKVPPGKIAFDNTTYSISEALQICLSETELSYELINNQIRIYTTEASTTKLKPITVLGEINTEKTLVSNSSTLSKYSLNNRIAKPTQTISKSYMNANKSNSVEDSLDLVSGVEYFQTTGGFQSKFYSRGIPTVFTIDGNPHRITTNVIDPFFLERIDILQGPSINYVEQGATLNFVTKKPTKRSRVLLEGFSSDNGTYRLASDINLNSSTNTSFRLVSLYEERKDKNLLIGEKYALAPSLSTSLFSEDELLISLYHAFQKENPRTITYHHSVLGYKPDRDLIFGADWSFAKSSDSFVSAHYSIPTHNNMLVSTEINWSDYTLDSELAIIGEPIPPGFFPDTQPGDAPVLKFTNKDVRYLSYGLNLSLESEFNLFSKNAFAKFSLDNQILYQTTPHYKAIFLQDTFNIHNPNYDISHTDVQNGGSLDHRIQFLGASYSFLQSLNSKAQWNIDIRYDDTSFRLQDHREESSTSVFDWDISGKFEEFSGELGVRFKLPFSTELYSAHSQSHTYQAVVDADDVDDPFRVEGSILPPVKNYQYELSLEKKLLDGMLSSQLSLYQIESQNIYSFGVSQDGNTYQNTKLNDRTSKGYSLDLKGKLSDSFEILANYSRNTNQQSIVTAANYLNFDISNPANEIKEKRLLSTAKLVANFWLQYKPQQGILRDFSWNIGAKHVGKRHGDDENSFILKPYERFDMTIEYSGLKNTQLALTARNIFDTYYYKSSYGVRYMVELGDPRTIFLTLRTSI